MQVVRAGDGSPGGSPRRVTARARIAAVAIAATTLGCDVNSALEQVSEARRRSADLLVQFTKASDAANRAVMADTDDASVAFAREADEAKGLAEKDALALASILQGLGYSEEERLLQEFDRRFAEYRELDRTVLQLAVENTNLKAQRLSFGPAQEAADAFSDAVALLAPMDPAKDKWRAKALAATAVGMVREIQALQAPHIADPDDAAMTRMEKRMATAEAASRGALAELAPLVRSGSLTAAQAALDRFTSINAEIMAMSRRNTNVRSLALSLNQKGKLTAACEESLHALGEALAKRGFTGTR